MVTTQSNQTCDVVAPQALKVTYEAEAPQPSEVEAPHPKKVYRKKSRKTTLAYGKLQFYTGTETVFSYEQDKMKEMLRPREIIIQEDQEALNAIREYVSLWPERYTLRFQKWYINRQKKQHPDMVDRTFTQWAVVNKDDVFHHLRNWDAGLRKALLKNTLIDNTRKIVNRIYYKEKRQNQRSAQHGTHTHAETQLSDKDLIAPALEVNECTINPITRHAQWTPKFNLMEEQGDSGTTTQDLEMASSISSTANITFVDERPIDTTQLHTKGSFYTNDTSYDIAENDWTLNSVLTREYPIKDFEWKTTQGTGDKLIEEGIPKIITDQTNCMITRQLRFFSFLRAGVKIRIQLNGTKFHCGRLIAYFVPLTWNDDTEENFYGISAFPNIFLDASISNSGEINIPFTQMMSYFSQAQDTLWRNSSNSLGRLIIRPYNPLRASDTASQSLYGQIYVSLIAPSVHLPTQEITTFSYTDGYLQGVEGLLKRTAGSLIDSGIGIMDKFTGGLVTGAGDAICNLLGICDKPIDPVSAGPIINRTVAPLCHGAGLDRSVRLALSPVSQTNTDPAILGALDSDFNLKTLCQIPTLLQQVDWKSSDTPGTKLFDMLVTPTYLSNPQYTANETGRFTNYTPTMLAYISRAFCLWRGTLKIKIQVIATQFHSGRLALVYDPHGNAKLNLTSLDNNKNHNIVIMDLQEQQELVVDLPYFSVKPWTRCDKFRADANLIDLAGIVNPSYLDCDITGIFRMFVINSLVKPTNVVDNIQINVFFYAGDNFQLSIPNPVTPLSPRKGPTGIQYSNSPRYPWCKTGDPDVCNVNVAIYNLWLTGKRLYENGMISSGTNWYDTSTIKVKNYDTIRFYNSLKKLAYYLESASEWCKTYINSLPKYDAVPPSSTEMIELMVEQGVESFTTTREKEGADVTITDGNNQSQVAPRTVSEDSMNLQTLLRRYYPLYVSPTIRNSNNFTIITIPVSPSFVPDMQDESLTSPLNRRFDVNNLAWFARLYTYWRGSMRYKVLVNSPTSDIYVWHNPVDTKLFNFSSGFDSDHLVDVLNFASDVAVTQVQQGVEVEVPYYSAFNQLCHTHISTKQELRASNGVLYIALRNTTQDINVSIFVSTGDDFILNVLRSPPVLHEPFAEAYTDASLAEVVRYPELQKALTGGSSTTQIPGTYVFDRYYEGVFKTCDIPDFSYPQYDIHSLQIMEEQMFSAPASITKLAQSYEEDIKPLIPEAKDTLLNLNTLVKDLQEQTIPQMLGHAKVFHQDLNNTHDTIKQFLPQVEDLFSHVNATAANLNVASSFVKDAAKQTETFFDWATWLGRTLNISGLWLNLILLHQKFTYTSLLNVILNFCGAFRVQTHTIVQWLWQYLQQFYEDCRSKVPYGAMSEQGFEEILSEYKDETALGLAVVATIIYCALFGVLPSFKKIKDVVKATVIGTEQGSATNEFLKSIHFNNLGLTAMDKAFKFFKEWMDKLVAWYLGEDCPEILLEKQFNEKAEQIKLWIKEISELEDEDFYHLALTDINIHNKFYTLADKGNEFLSWLINNKSIPPNTSIIIRDAYRKLTEMIKRINEIRPGHGYRYAPFVVCLHGETSTGKSEMMHHITKQLRETMKVPVYNSVYAVPSNDKYLSGYEGQPIVEWDDMLQNTEQDAMVAEFIQWCSNADTKINMADLSHKGNHFVSKAIVCTTNCAYVQVNTVRDMEAFRRRRNVVVGVQFAPGHTKDTMVDAEQDDTFSHAVFAILDNVSGQVLIPNLSWDAVLEYINEKHRAWDLKQLRKVEEYFASTPSLRIPRGVVIAETEEYFDAEDVLEEQGLRARYTCTFDATGLTEEEQLDAELFTIHFENCEKDDKLSYYTLFKNRIKQLNLKPRIKRYYEILTQKLNIITQKLTQQCKDFYTQHPNLTYTLGVITMFGVVGTFLKFLLPMFSSLNGEESYDSNVKITPKLIKAEAYDTVSKVSKPLIKAEHYEATSKIPKPLIRAEGYDSSTRAPKRIVRAEAFEEGTNDVAAVELARAKIHPLMNIVEWQETPFSLQAISICGKLILVPHHFFRRAKEGDFFAYYRGDTKVLIEFTPKHLFRIRDKDACLYYMGARFDSRKNILNCFISEEQLPLISKSVDAILVGLHPSGTLMEKAGKAKGNTYMQYQGKDAGAPIYKQFGWEYAFNTVNGECGSILVACSPRLPPPSKIIGIHTAGYHNKVGGFSILLTREMIQETLDIVDLTLGSQVIGASLPPQVIQDEQAFAEKCKIVPQGDFSYYGVMNSKFCPSQPLKTKLKPTPFQGELYPVTKIPAQLTNKNGVSPLNNALGKYGKTTIPFKNKHIKIVSKSILNDLLMLDSDLETAPVSIREACFGVPGVPYIDKMNMKSSPGWPYQCLDNSRQKEGKRYLFDEERQEIADPLLLSNLQRRTEMAKNGERYPSIWRDCLKDELRPEEKVLAGKTRLFTIAPVDFTILCRQYFLPFVSAFYKGYSTFFSSVGINAESYDWTVAYNRLRSYGDKCIAGDFGSFDGTLMADLMFETGEIINDWYRQKGDVGVENARVRRVLIDEMIHTYQLVQNCVYKTHQGNPSGNPLTVIINTIVNAFYMRLTWMEIMAEKAPQLCTMDAYQENVIEEMYGDDNRLVVKEEVLEIFNQVTITDCFARHGITYTDEEKTSKVIPYKFLKDTSFLKRKYRQDKEIGNEIMLPVMNLDTITSLTNWYREGIDTEEQLLANQRSALGFAFFYGREFYESFYTGYSQKLRDLKIKPLNLTYDELLELFLGDVRGEKRIYSKFMHLDFSLSDCKLATGLL